MQNRRSASLALSSVLALTAALGAPVVAPQPAASASTPRDVITVTGGEVFELDGSRYHLFTHDPIDTFQGHDGGAGCTGSCGGTNHGGGGGGGLSGPGLAGTIDAGGDGGAGYGGGFVPTGLRTAVTTAGGPAIGEVASVAEQERVWFGGGGGGGTFFQTNADRGPGTAGNGGHGGGADGAVGVADATSTADDAPPHTGGGGGGSGSAAAGRGIGGDGGSGVVVLRWETDGAPDVTAPGAAIVPHDDGFTYAVFVHDGPGTTTEHTVTFGATAVVEYLVVGGGGGGGGEPTNGYGGGGGGGGGVVTNLGRPVELVAGSYAVTVGAGGAGGDGTGGAQAGAPGSPSRFGDLAVALGGGGGAGGNRAATAGGSGGGGTTVARTGGAGRTSQTSATLSVDGGSVDADVLLVAGGGGAGRNRGAGGGAGALLLDTGRSLSGTLSVLVGGGGRGGSPWPVSGAAGSASPGCDGGASAFAEVTVRGGGGGGARDDLDSEDCFGSPTTASIDGGRDGGSGGGGSYRNDANVSVAGGEATAVAPALGSAGGAGGDGSARAAGGGGAGEAGASTGDGGDGVASFAGTPLAPFGVATSTGERIGDDVWFGGGGGGFASPLPRPGGQGGGADSAGNPDASLTVPRLTRLAGYSILDGAPATGGGGGGCANDVEGCRGGDGGSGVVIVRYPIPVWQQDADLGYLRIDDALAVGALVGDPDDAVAASLELVDGTLPTGITLDGSGALTGTATTEGAFTFTLRAFDRASGAGVAVDRTFTVEVFDALLVAEDFADAPGDAWVLSGGGGWTPTVVDAVVDGTSRGALRVTPTTANTAGFALYDIPQQARAGIDISFRVAMWQAANTRGADGFAFFLKRGDDTSTTPGAFGSRAGFGTGGSTPGVSGALLGVGLDTFGGFMRHVVNGEPGGFTCPSHTDVGQTEDNATGSPNNVSVRGPGQGLEGYCLLAPHVTVSPGWGRTDSDTGGGTRSRDAAARDVRVRYDYLDGSPATGRVRVWVDDVADGDTPLIDIPAPAELVAAETFKFGFSGSVGNQFNNQEVWDVVVRSVVPVERAAWSDDTLEPAVIGEPYPMVDLAPRVTGGIRPFTFARTSGDVPPGMSVGSTISGTPTAPGTYTFTVRVTEAQPTHSAPLPLTLVVKDEQTLELDVPTQRLGSGSVVVAPVSRARTSQLATGLPVTVTSTTPDVCTTSGSGLTVTLVAVGTCTLSASQPGGTSGALSYVAAEPITASFEVLPGAAPTLAAPVPEPEPQVRRRPLPDDPMLVMGIPPRPSLTPTARVGDVELAVASMPAGTIRQLGSTTVSTATILEVGGVSLALDLTGAGEVRTDAGAAPQVRVARDAVARTSGGGLLPDTEVRAWLPLAGTDARPITTIPVGADGTFSGELPFDGRADRASDGRPLPIGRHVLQLVGVDAAGELTVIEQTVRIEQPDPSPEPDRTAGAPPALTPGASVATNGGLPEAVTVVPVPDARQARVEGSGWTMAVDIPSADGRVAPADGGGALIELVAEDVAEVSGDGFLAGTRADVWLFSTPTLLGSVTIAADGTFSGEVDVTGIATGEHTLQLQGVGRDGYVRAANLGVVVVPRATDGPDAGPDPQAAPEPTPEPAPEPTAPADRVEVVTAAGEDTERSSLLLWIAIVVAAAASGGWFLLGRRRRDGTTAGPADSTPAG